MDIANNINAVMVGKRLYQSRDGKYNVIRIVRVVNKDNEDEGIDSKYITTSEELNDYMPLVPDLIYAISLVTSKINNDGTEEKDIIQKYETSNENLSEKLELSLLILFLVLLANDFNLFVYSYAYINCLTCLDLFSSRQISFLLNNCFSSSSKSNSLNLSSMILFFFTNNNIYSYEDIETK